MNASLFEYIKEEGILDAQLFDTLRYELAKHVYYYGSHFRSPNEQSNPYRLKGKFSGLLKNLYVYSKIISKRNGRPIDANVVSTAYFDFGSTLEKLGYNVFEPFWSVTSRWNRSVFGNLELLKTAQKLSSELRRSDFNYLLSPQFIDQVVNFKENLANIYLSQKIRALFVPNDVSFFENLSIEIFKEIGRPSFIFLHGLPGRYNHIDENRADYLIVWGDRIKSYYINAGFKADKIIVCGHPYYRESVSHNLRFHFSDILILPKIAVGSPHSTGFNSYDRGNLILYLLLIKKVLKPHGVKKVRIRFHPSSNPVWHYKFIDKSFFIQDKLPLSDSLKKATLVIGPTSTVFLEAICAGVNYVVFEPALDGLDILNERVVPPFDGSEKAIPVAKNIDELRFIIKHKVSVQSSILQEYIKTPFDINNLNKLI